MDKMILFTWRGAVSSSLTEGALYKDTSGSCSIPQSQNLLFFASDYQVGQTTALTEQCLGIQKLRDVHLTVVTGDKEMEPGLRDKLLDAKCDVHVLPELDIHSSAKAKAMAIAKLIDEKRIDVVNVHNNWQMVLVALVRTLRLSKRSFKTIYTIHGYRHNSAWKSFIAIYVIGLMLLLFANKVISMSGYVSRRFWFIKYKIRQVYYIMAKPQFNKSSNEILELPLKIVFPAQFRHGKNQDRLIRIIRRYIDITKDTSIRVWLPGAGDTLERCKQLAEELSLSGNIIFTGLIPHKEVISLYEQANIGLAMTNVETYGRCIAEPFALGRCVISRRTGIAEDIIRHGENGFLFSSDKDLLNILLQLHKSPHLVLSNAQKAFEERIIFSEHSVLKSYLEIMQSLA